MYFSRTQKTLNRALWQRIILILTAVWIAAALSACAAGSAAPAASGSSAAGPAGASPEGYAIAINVGDQTLAYINLDQLKSLEAVAVRAAERDNEGPTLLSIIELGGISEFQTVTVIGLDRGRMANAELLLNRDQVNDQTILDITNRGTCKFASPDIAFENWVYDVSALTIVK